MTRGTTALLTDGDVVAAEEDVRLISVTKSFHPLQTCRGEPSKFGSFGLQLVLYFEGFVGLDFVEAIKVQLSYEGAVQVGKQCCVSFFNLEHDDAMTMTYSYLNL